MLVIAESASDGHFAFEMKNNILKALRYINTAFFSNRDDRHKTV